MEGEKLESGSGWEEVLQEGFTGEEAEKQTEILGHCMEEEPGG